MSRRLSSIAADIKKDWFTIPIHALVYVEAMERLTRIKDTYINDTGRDIVLRFLCNATSWRGEVARNIKKELREILKNE
jgi:hypothetical protein